ncbi:MAG: T9SS type A sorting domain-containing protein [Ignavibacteria bacterium]|jgi:hypothetical protein
MKKIVFLVCIISLLAIESKSQNFIFRRVSPAIVTGDTSTLVVVKAILTNNASTTQSFILERVYKNFPTGWVQNVCNYQNCFGESEIIPPDGGPGYTLGAGQSDTVLSFDFYGTTIGTGQAVWRAYVRGTPSVYIQDTFTVHLGPVGITPISSVVKDYELKQNYPNPFNPSTSIEFSLQKNSDVNLVVYDMQGKEVARLLNNTKLAQGSYKYDFNSGEFNLSSGVYFYKLVTGDFVSTRKMLLIK